MMVNNSTNINKMIAAPLGIFIFPQLWSKHLAIKKIKNTDYQSKYQIKSPVDGTVLKI
jgi:hypothetical protein